MERLLVVCMVLVRNQKVLLFRKGLESNRPGLWELPGGKVLPNETLFEAIVREMFEELQWSVELVKKGRVTSQNEKVELVPIEVEVVDFQFSLSEHDQFRWVGLKDLNSLSISRLDIPILKSYLK